jgi:hypothetical protein
MQTLVVQTTYFHDSDRADAVALGRELYNLLTRPLGDPLAYGAGIPVVVAVSREHLDLRAAVHTIVVPVLGAVAHANAAVRAGAAATIGRWAADLGDGHVLPVFTADGWRCLEGNGIDGTPVLDRLARPDSWLGTAIAVALAAARLLSTPEQQATLFISHAKVDLERTGRAAEALAEFARNATPGGRVFFDRTDLASGRSLQRQLDDAAGRGVFVAFRTDAYASRPWCERELLCAKRAQLPTITVVVLKDGESRSYPYSGNGPTVVWRPPAPLPPDADEAAKAKAEEQERDAIAAVFLRAVVEWLRARHFVLETPRLRKDAPVTAVQSRPPELLDLAQGPLLATTPSLVLHPDPEVSAAERAVLREARPRMRLITPSTLYRGLGSRQAGDPPGPVHAPLYRCELAMSVSDSPDAGGEQGFTAEHVKDATVLVGRTLVSAGAMIAYAGDLRPGGNDDLFAGLIAAYNASGEEATELLIKYIPAAVDFGAFARQRRGLVFTGRWLGEDPWRDRAALAPPPVSKQDELVYLSDVRRLASLQCFARVLLAGQLAPQADGANTGYLGAYPGVLEEAWWTLQLGKPMYVIGGFGGATGALADLLRGKPLPRLLTAPALAGPEYSEYRQRAAAFATDPRTALLGVPPTMESLVADLQARGARLLASDEASRSWNGLTVAENQRLFTSRDPIEITQLLMQGLLAVALRQLPGKLQIELVRGNLLQVEGANAIALGTFQNTPLGGAAAAVDEELSSRVTTALRAKESIVEMPTSEVDADWLLLADLGAVSAGDPAPVLDNIERGAASVAVTARRHGFRKLGLVTFGSSAHDDLQAVVARMLAGLAPLGAREETRCTLQWFENDPARYEALRIVLEKRDDVVLSCRALPIVKPPVVHRARDVLVTIRYENESMYVTIQRPAGAAATYYGHFPVTSAAYARAARLGAAYAPAELLDAQHCEALAAEIFGQVGARYLGETRGDADAGGFRLVIQHDLRSAAVPFEALRAGGTSFGLSHGVVRRPALEDPPLFESRPPRRGTPRLLLIVNPTGDLRNTAAEAAIVRERAAATHVIDELVGRQATRNAILDALANPDLDVVHYCGHAFYRGPESHQSGLLCADGNLTAEDLAGQPVAPRLAVFNACNIGRVRDVDPLAPPPQVATAELTRAFAAYFLRAGIEAYVGTLWPVMDNAAANFTAAMYEALAAGKTVDESVLAGRNALHAAKQADWANYVLYGDGQFRLTSPA